MYIFLSLITDWYISGLVFENLNDHMYKLPSHVHYKIRQNATLNPETNIIRPPFWYPSPGSNNLLYYDFGFVWIQVKKLKLSFTVGVLYQLFN
jgi:hypothetical protein